MFPSFTTIDPIWVENKKSLGTTQTQNYMIEQI